MVALLEQLGSQRAQIRVPLNVTALSLDQELFFGRYLDRHPISEVHLSGADCPMMPMRCPKCCSGAIRAPITNNKLDDQVVRKRICTDCGHKWFTVEVAVPDYAVGWSAEHLRKPVLRAPVTVKAAHQEPKDRLVALREASERRSLEADLRHRVAKCD